MPPSTIMGLPVMKLARSDSMKTPAWAISSAFAMRLIGCRPATKSMKSWLPSPPAGVTVPPGKQCIDANALCGVISRQGLHKANQPSLGRCVGTHARQAAIAEANKGRREHDRAAAPSQQRGNLRLGSKKGARQVHRDYCVPIVEGHLGGRLHVTDNTGIVEGAVEPAERVLREFNEGFGVIRVADIPRHGGGPPGTVAIYFLGEAREFWAASRPQHNVCPLPGKEPGGGRADTAAGARDDNRLVLQFHDQVPWWLVVVV